MAPGDRGGSAARRGVTQPARLTTMRRSWPGGTSASIRTAPSCSGYCAANEGRDAGREWAVILGAAAELAVLARADTCAPAVLGRHARTPPFGLGTSRGPPALAAPASTVGMQRSREREGKPVGRVARRDWEPPVRSRAGCPPEARNPPPGRRGFWPKG